MTALIGRSGVKNYDFSACGSESWGLFVGCGRGRVGKDLNHRM